MTTPTAHINARAASLAAALLAGLVAAAGIAFLVQVAAVSSRPAAGRALIVHAERTGIRLGDNALTGRVDLVASVPGLRWRIAGVTGWRQAPGRVLVRSWDTEDVPDGPYALELRTHGLQTARTLVVRNVTPVTGYTAADQANASAGLSLSPTDARAVVASFGRSSYRPGEVAVLTLARAYPAVRIELLRCGPEQQLTIGNETMEGIPVAERRVHAVRVVRIAIGAWPSGVYTARLTSTRGRVGFAPFVIRPRRLGEHRVAVVQPNYTWQAYNYRDGDDDGRPDSWYGNGRSRVVDVTRPYLDRGVPPHFRQYDVSFLRWLTHSGREVDMLAQEDIEQVSGDRLARLYDLIVFPGHHEYVTEGEYDAVRRYRDLGGNLAFLSANNFFWRVDRRGTRIYRIAMWRDLGRPESALVGVQYFDWNHGTYGSRPYRLVAPERAPWLFAGVAGRGDALGQFGIEVDGRTAASPRSIRVLAVLENAFGTGRPAEMTYYETRRGAKVFAAGAFTLAGTQARQPGIWRLLENLWDGLATLPIRASGR